MDLSKLDHPLSSAAQLSGFPRWIGRVKFILAPLNNRNRAFRIFGAQHLITDENIPQLLADAAILGWEDLSADGEPVPYSKEAALEVMQLHPALADAVLKAAQELADEEQDQHDEDIAELKNSRPGNGGGQATKSTMPSPQEQVLMSAAHQR